MSVLRGMVAGDGLRASDQWTVTRLGGCYLPKGEWGEGQSSLTSKAQAQLSCCRPADGCPPPSSHPLCPWHPLLLTATLQAVLGASLCALWEIVPLPLPPTMALLIVYIAVC